MRLSKLFINEQLDNTDCGIIYDAIQIPFVGKNVQNRITMLGFILQNTSHENPHATPATRCNSRRSPKLT
jgi:hypothetical protein